MLEIGESIAVPLVADTSYLNGDHIFGYNNFHHL
jgi:hypothetical protein